MLLPLLPGGRAAAPVTAATPTAASLSCGGAALQEAPDVCAQVLVEVRLLLLLLLLTVIWLMLAPPRAPGAPPLPS